MDTCNGEYNTTCCSGSMARASKDTVGQNRLFVKLLTSDCYGYFARLGHVLNSDHDCKNLIRFDCTLTLIHVTREPDCKPLLMANNDTVHWVLHMSPGTA